jgi:glycosyltransferase involved in cell wall biosynthesis
MVEAFRKSDVEILLSTMNRDNLDFLVPMFPFAHFSDFNILIVNQTTQDQQLISNYPTVRVINVIDKGLSKSRNLALQNASKKIGLIADDDLVFLEGFDSRVAQGFNRFTQAAAIKYITTTFEGVPFRRYPKVPLGKLTAMQRLSSTSWEIALSIEVVRRSGILFDTLFGLGSVFPLGEEPVFLNDLYNAGYQVCHEPEVIVTHKAIKDSDNITLAENYRIRAAYLTRIFKWKMPIWLAIQLMYHIKQGIVKPNKIIYSIQHALKGKQQLLSLSKNENKP